MDLFNSGLEFIGVNTVVLHIYLLLDGFIFLLKFTIS